MDNLRGLGAALGLYATDHDSHLPPAARWSDSAADYGSDVQIMHCPSVTQFGYAFNRGLGGKSTATASKDAATPLLFDSSHLAPNANDEMTSLPSPPRHTDKSGVRGNLAAFLDGHADWVRH